VCTELALFTRLYRDARSTEHKIQLVYIVLYSANVFQDNNTKFIKKRRIELIKNIRYILIQLYSVIFMNGILLASPSGMPAVA